MSTYDYVAPRFDNHEQHSDHASYHATELNYPVKKKGFFRARSYENDTQWRDKREGQS
jgi:hypothetical protein